MILQIQPSQLAANICRTWAQCSEYCGRLPTAGLWWGMERIFSDGGMLVSHEVEWLKERIQWMKCQGYDELAMAQARSDHALVASLQRSIDEVDYVYDLITSAPDVEFDEEDRLWVDL